jgi:hypothetical protein
MRAHKLAAGLWIAGGLYSTGMAFGVLDEPIILALAVAGGIVGLTIGALLLARPGARAVRWSNVAGIAWLIAFVALAVGEVALQMGYVGSVLILTALGASGALLAYWRRGSVPAA